MIDDQDQWTVLSSALGEALLDVERTFMTVVDGEAQVWELLPYSATSSPVRAYFDAKSRLDNAHRELTQFLVRHRRPQLHELRCGECSQELR